MDLRAVIRPQALRLTLARALCWCLMLSGWLLAAGLAPGGAADPAHAFVACALWLLLLGVAVELGGRLKVSMPVWRALLLAAACTLAAALWLSVRLPGWPGLAGVLAAHAWMLALATRGVRLLRAGHSGPPAHPAGAAALGALLTILVVGIPDGSLAVRERLAAAVLACGVLCALLPAAGAVRLAGRCRAGLFECALPDWRPAAWAQRHQTPLLLARLTMLPMMGGLPAMAARCSPGGQGVQALLALHLGAMFLPACIWPSRLAASGWLPIACALLLAAAAASALPAGGAVGSTLEVVLSGAAWSLAWRAQPPVAAAVPAPAPVVAGMMNALLALLLAAGNFPRPAYPQVI